MLMLMLMEQMVSTFETTRKILQFDRKYYLSTYKYFNLFSSSFIVDKRYQYCSARKISKHFTG